MLHKTLRWLVSDSATMKVLIVVLVIGTLLVLSMLALRTYFIVPFQRQDQVIAELKKTVNVDIPYGFDKPGPTVLEGTIRSITHYHPENDCQVRYLTLTSQSEQSVIILDDKSMRQLVSMPFLQGVNFERILFSATGSTFYAKNVKMSGITFIDITFDATIIRTWTPFSNVKILVLNKFRFSEDGLSELLNKFPNLEKLLMSDPIYWQPSDTDIDSIKRCPNLRCLSLTNISISNDQRDQLAPLLRARQW